MRGSLVVVRENKTRTLYMASSSRDMVFVVDNNANLDLWHCRLGHISEKKN